MNRLRHWLVCLCPALFLLARPAHAATVVWADGFETNAASRWQITAGVWKLMNPTVGPPVNVNGYRTHTGTNCACTQGYGYSKDSRLFCSRFNGSSRLVVPDASLSPRLRFWQWFNFGNALGYVEITTNGADWIQISPTYLDLNGGGVWSRPSLDLSPYAGQSIVVAFHFTSGGCCGNGLGWFVDDVEVDTGPEQLNFPESFEFDPKQSDWSEDFGTWEIGRPDGGPFSTHGGTNCAGTVLDGSYLNNVDTRLISPPFSVPASGVLNFWHWYSFNNALGFVEINNGTTITTSVTNVTIVTNGGAGTINTNIYQLSGALIPGYATNFYWNPTINGWTNGTKAMGSVYDFNAGNFLFEAGNAPLLTVGGPNVDYGAVGFFPVPPTTTPTNFIVWEGMVWSSPLDVSDEPVGYFATNSGSVTYTTNTTITVTTTTWVPISSTYGNGNSGGNWTNVSLDLSTYAGQAVQIAFHFTSGGINTAAGWYVDDLTLAAPPTLTVPDDQVIYSGDLLSVTATASNSLLPNAKYTFRLLSPPANVFITNGVITWQTSPDQPSSTNTITVVATDNDVPPFSATNSFTVTVVNPFVLTVPSAQKIYAGQTMSVTIFATNNLSDSDTFTYTLLSPLLPNMDDSDLPVDGVLNWPTTLTQTTGTFKVTIGATDDDPPYYGATNSFNVTISKTPAPVLTVPATQNIYAGQIMTVTNYASSAAFPGGPFVFTLLSDPTGISVVDYPTNEVLTWAGYPTNKSSFKTITLMVTDPQSGLSATNSFRVNISPSPPPTLLLPGTQTNYAGMTLTVTNYATNVALSSAVFSFRLLAPSTNVWLATNGVLTWTNTGVKNGILIWTNNSISPGTQVITLAVDTLPSGYPAGLIPVSATNHFNIVFVPPHPPSVLVPANLETYVGQKLTVTAVATNNYVLLTNVSYAFKASTNLLLAGQGMITWTNTAAPPGVYGIFVKVTDNSLPPLSATNTAVLAVLPYPSQLALTNVGILSKSGHAFAFGISTPWTNTPWRIIATTNLAGGANWLPVYTNQNGPVGAIMFTDRLSTNFLQRYYRAVFP